MSELPDSELLRVQEQLRLKAGQEQSDPEYFENMANRIGKILKEGQSEVPTYSVPGMARTLNYEGKHITQVMSRFEDAPIGFRVLLSTVEIENYDKRYQEAQSDNWFGRYHLLVKESEKHWIRVDENNLENQVVWDAEFSISMVKFGASMDPFGSAAATAWGFGTPQGTSQDTPQGTSQDTPQDSVGQVKIASTWAISGKE